MEGGVPTMPTAFHRWTRKYSPLKALGQRGQVLFLLGWIYTLIGVSLILVRNDPVARLGYTKILEIAPLEFWGGVWITVGVVAIYSASRRTGRDVWGFAAITCWTLLWAAQAFFNLARFGVLLSLVGFLVWTALAGISMIVAGMWGKDDEVPPREDGGL